MATNLALQLQVIEPDTDLNSIMIGNSRYSDDVWEKTKEENDTSKIDPNIGFSFDRKPVETEISNCVAVNEEYKGLSKGLYSDYEAVYEESQEKLKKAGIDIIKDEIDAQYAAWKEAQ